MAASITRRSAGLPMLIRAIVSSEGRGKSGGRHLLGKAVSGLLQILQLGSSGGRDAMSTYGLKISKCRYQEDLGEPGDSGLEDRIIQARPGKGPKVTVVGV